MKLATHIVTGFSFAFTLQLYTTLFSPNAVVAAGIAGLEGALVNAMIDWLGHERGWYKPKRARWAHSLLGTVIIGLAVHGYIGLVALILLDMMITPYPVLAASLLHLLLDAVTEGGVYPLWPLSNRRLRILGLDYDNKPANIAAITLTLVLLAFILYNKYPEVIAWLESLGH